MDHLNNFWKFIENELHCKIPEYLQGLLEIQGFCSVISIMELDDEDIQYMEFCVRDNGYAFCLSTYVDFKDYYNFDACDFKTELKKFTNFEILRGHKKLLKAIVKFVAQKVDSAGLSCFLGQCSIFDNSQQQKVQATVGAPLSKANEPESTAEDSILFVKESSNDIEDTIVTTTNEEVFGRIKEILNELVPDDFDTLWEEIKNIDTESDELLQVLTYLVFEKAMHDPRLCAKLCHQLAYVHKWSMFKKTLISKCQKEYQRVIDEKSVVEEFKPFLIKFKESGDPKYLAQYQDKERIAKQRSIGVIQFISELFLLRILTPNIMNTVVDSLLKLTTEDKFEFICIFLTIIGDRSAVLQQKLLNRCFQHMNEILTEKYPKISGSTRFLILLISEKISGYRNKELLKEKN